PRPVRAWWPVPTGGERSRRRLACPPPVPVRVSDQDLDLSPTGSVPTDASPGVRPGRVSARSGEVGGRGAAERCGMSDAAGLEERRRQHGRRDLRDRDDGDGLDLGSAGAGAVGREGALALAPPRAQKVVNEMRRLRGENRHEGAGDEETRQRAPRRGSADSPNGHSQNIYPAQTPFSKQKECGGPGPAPGLKSSR